VRFPQLTQTIREHDYHLASIIVNKIHNYNKIKTM